MKRIMFYTMTSIILVSGQLNIVSPKIPRRLISNITPYCQLFDSMNNGEKSVRTTAVLFIPARGEPRVDGGSDEYFYSKSCNNKDYFARADFSKTENVNLMRNISRPALANDTPTLLAVTFSGKISLSYIPVFGHLGWLRAEIAVDKIESAKLIKIRYPLPDHESYASILETGNSLRFVNADLMVSLFRYGLTEQHHSELFTNKTRIDLDGRVARMTDIPRFDSNQDSISFRVQTDKATKLKDRWIIRGSVTVINHDRSKNKIFFENWYNLQADNSWKLVLSRLNRVDNEQ